MITASLFHVLVLLAICGVLLYLLNAFVPMDGKFKTAINVIVGVCLFLYVAQLLFGMHW